VSGLLRRSNEAVDRAVVGRSAAGALIEQHLEAEVQILFAFVVSAFLIVFACGGAITQPSP
jgi:hypothetical protein